MVLTILLANRKCVGVGRAYAGVLPPSLRPRTAGFELGELGGA